VNDLPAIAALYEQVDNYFDDLRDRCDAAGDGAERDRVEREQRINDQAYFVLAWGQLEAEVDDACGDAIRQGQAHGDWRSSRAWSLYDPENPRLSFRNRLRLVLDESTDEWRRTIDHYRVRNDIAHGTLLSQRIDVSSVIQDFFLIQASLIRN
jgi:hypothetical protein